MRNLEKMVLSDNEVMDVKAMKAVVGGQVINQTCRNTGSGSGIGSSANVVCSGECPTMQPGATGTTGPNIQRTCKLTSSMMNGSYFAACECV